MLRAILNKCCILTFDPAKNTIQSDALEGSDTFQWQLLEEIAQVSSADNMGQGEGPTSEWWTEREWPVNCMTFPLHDDQTYHSKDWVGVELLYNSV